jgi:hypothetical protein
MERKEGKRYSKKTKRNIRNGIIFVIVCLIFLFLVLKYPNGLNQSYKENTNNDPPTSNNINQNSELNNNYVTLYFYENKTLCPLNGNITIKDKLVGESKDGEYPLPKTEYYNIEGSEIELKGLTDSCFGSNANLPFIEYWTLPDLDNSFEDNETAKFVTEFNPRLPRYYEEMQGFIRPYEAKERLSRIPLNENNSDLKNLDIIFESTYMNYVTDQGQFGKSDYWQTPKNFIDNKGGDCEDWAIYTVSLIRAYNPNLNCYAASWLTHMNVLCAIENKFIILDQEKIRGSFTFDNKLILQDNEVNAHTWINNYFAKYGIPPDERIIYELFNEKDIIVFENGQKDFFNWVMNTGLSFYNESEVY